MDFVTVDQAARMTGLPPKTIRRRIAQGRLEAFRSGVDMRRLLVKRDEVARMVEPQPAKRAA